MFTYYSISALINFLFSLLSSVFLIITDRKNLQDKTVFTFLRFAFFVICWSAFYFLWQISDNYNDALLYSKLLIAFAAFIPLAFLDYVMTFLDYDTKRNKFFIVIGYLIFWLFVFQGLVSDVVPKMSFNYWPNGTSIFPIFLFLWSAVFISSVVILIHNLLKIKTNDLKHRHILFLTVAIIIGMVGGITNFFLWLDIPVKPYGNILVSIYFFISLYTIGKYNVKNISLFYTELASLAITMFAFGKIFVSENKFGLYSNILLFLVTAVASIYIINSSKRQERGRLLLEKALKRGDFINKKLIELDKHKDDFVSIAAHQLRTPAGIIKNYMSIMKQGLYGELPERLNDPVNRAYENSVLLTETVSSLLDISRIESGKQKIDFKTNDISELIKNIVSELKGNAQKKNLELNLEIREGVNYRVVFDHEKMDHMLSNLIDNSIIYTEKGKVDVKLYGNEFYILINVTDTGRGMSKSFIENQLYQKFAREENVGTNISGNGLGMYFVKEVVDLHKGKISVVSEQGKGTTFTVAIPTKLKEGTN